MYPLCHRVCDHAVDPDQRQEQSDQRQCPHQLSHDSVTPNVRSHRFLER